MIQRRKGATYGKPTRKPISDLSSFAEASEPPTRHTQQRLGDENVLSTKAVAVKLAQRSMLPKPAARTLEAVPPPLQKHTSSKHDGTNSDIAMYDFPHSEEEEEEQKSESSAEITSRKRRKLTLMSNRPLTSAVYDDESLQRHIAAEMSVESTADMEVMSRAVTASKVSSPVFQGNFRVSKQRSPSPTKGRGPTSFRDPYYDVPRSYDNSELKKPIAQKAAPSNLGGNKVSTKTSTSYKSQTVNEKSTHLSKKPQKPPREDTLPAASARKLSGSKQSHEKQGHQPSTPPRGSTAMATTPKQRELWGRLLSNEPQSSSPSKLDLPKLTIADRKVSLDQPIASSRTHTAGETLRAKSGMRPAKLVDFLITSEHDTSHSPTESSEEFESSDFQHSESVVSEASVDDENLTTQTSPSAGSQSKRLPTQDPGSVVTSQRTSTLQGAPKVTYIRERTHLGDNDLCETVPIDVPLVPDVEFSKKRRLGASASTQSNHRSGSAEFDGLVDAQDSQGGGMRSIHELREAGGNTRMVGELEAALDDLDERIDTSKSSRRSSLMSLISKLLDVSTCRMFEDQGLEPRLLAQVNLSHDIIERSLLAAAILQILFHTASAAFLSQTNRARTTALLVGLLSDTQDLVRYSKLREANMSKVVQSEFSAICSALLRSPMWRSSKPPVLSGQLLALQGLDFLVRQAREAGSTADIVSADAIDCIVETAMPHIEASQPLTAYAKICLELAISILESSTISGAKDVRGRQWTHVTIERIGNVYPSIANAGGPGSSALQSLTLRFYLNLTNTNPYVCEVLSKAPLLCAILRGVCLHFSLLWQRDDNGDETSSSLDNIILSLGCLINLAESSDTMRQLALTLRDQEDSFMNKLLTIFLKKQGTAAEVCSCPPPFIVSC